MSRSVANPRSNLSRRRHREIQPECNNVTEDLFRVAASSSNAGPFRRGVRPRPRTVRRLRGLRAGLPARERLVGRNAVAARAAAQPATAARRPHLLPVGRLPPLRAAGLPRGLPVRRLREARRRHRRAPRGAVHRLPLLRDGVPVRRAAVLRRQARDDEVSPLPPSPRRGRSASLRGSLPDRSAARGRGRAAPSSKVARSYQASSDPAGCRPATRFLAPRGGARKTLLAILEERLHAR